MLTIKYLASEVGGLSPSALPAEMLGARDRGSETPTPQTPLCFSPVESLALFMPSLA